MVRIPAVVLQLFRGSLTCDLLVATVVTFFPKVRTSNTKRSGANFAPSAKQYL